MKELEKIIRDSVTNLVDAALDETLKTRVTENTTIALWMSPEARRKLKVRILNMMIALAEYRGELSAVADVYNESKDAFLRSQGAQLTAAIRTLEDREREYSDLLDTILDHDSNQDPGLP